MILRSLFALTLFAAASTASAQTVINSVPYTITASGKYVLGNNFVTASANQVAITINAPNVVLDLNDFFVSGPGNSTTINQTVISVGNVSNVKIRNGTVANNGFGIYFFPGANSINHLVENVNITRCLFGGVFFAANTASSIVRNCTISQIAGNTEGAGRVIVGISCGTGVRIENNFVDTVTGGTDNRGINQSVGSFAIGNTVVGSTIGVFGGKYQNNLTANCTTPFSSGIDAGLNN